MGEISLIVIQYGDPELLCSLFQSIDGHKDEELITESIIVNNGDKIPEVYKDDIYNLATGIDKNIVQNSGDSYSSGVNRGVKEATSDIIAISNNDIEWVKNESIEPLIETVSGQNIGVCSPQLINLDGSKQKTSMEPRTIRSELKSLFFYDKIVENLAGYKKPNIGYKSSDGFIIGAFMIMKKETFEYINGFDERFKFYGEDVDFCHRMKNAGYDVGVNNKCSMIHLGGSTSSEENEEYYAEQLFLSRLKYLNKHYSSAYTSAYIYVKLLTIVESVILLNLLSVLFGDEKWDRLSDRMIVELIALLRAK